MRSSKALLNSIISVIGQVINIFITFLTRIFFIRCLGEGYLGINGLFTQILSMLSLVELGIGPAIVFSLYKPIAEKNENQIHAIMALYKRIYVSIGMIIGLLGVVLAPFITVFIKGNANIPHLEIIFLLFVINTSISYFFSYKQNLIIADQNKYITVIYHYVSYIILNILQIIVLLKTKNFYLFLVLQITFTFIENFAISKKADKLYPFLKVKCSDKIDSQTMNLIKKNTKAMIYHKIGGVAVNSTDNLIISKFIGLNLVGIYSNYALVINSLITLIGQMFSSITSSIGNFNVDSKNEDKVRLFNILFFVNYIIYGVVSICTFCLVDDFVRLFFGEKLLLERFVVLLIVLKFYLAGMRLSIGTFKDAMGIYWQDRYRPLAEASINLVLSVMLVFKFGIAGIFIGTIISNILANLFVEPYILYKYGFSSTCLIYYKRYICYFLNFLIIGCLVVFISSYINVTNIIMLVLKSIIAFILSLSLILLTFCRTESFQYLKDLMLSIIKKINNKRREKK